MLDEMAIMKHITWTGKKYSGCVDIGSGAKVDETTPATTEALVIMIVGVNGH